MTGIDRRTLLKTAAAATAASGGLVSVGASAQGKPVVNMQLGWLFSGNQIGEVCAKAMGFYEQEGIEVKFQPGGPNIDGVAVVAAGRFEVGQVSSSPSLMLAASQDLPVICFATGAQEHPYAFFSLKKNPVREPKDLIGKKVGIQATGVILLRALLAKNKIPEKDVTIVTIGADMAPVMTGQVDVVTGWLTNTTALNVLGDQRVDMRLWDTGVKLYALPYYATATTLKTKADVLAKFLTASGKGWAYASANRDKAVEHLVKEFPNLDCGRRARRAGSHAAVQLHRKKQHRKAGARWIPAVWQDQINLYAELGQFLQAHAKAGRGDDAGHPQDDSHGRPKVG